VPTAAIVTDLVAAAPAQYHVLVVVQIHRPALVIVVVIVPKVLEAGAIAIVGVDIAHTVHIPLVVVKSPTKVFLEEASVVAATVLRRNLHPTR
jgi:hypothetical protein